MYGSLDNAGLVTIAPELPGAMEVIRHLASLGIKVSVGEYTFFLVCELNKLSCIKYLL